MALAKINDSGSLFYGLKGYNNGNERRALISGINISGGTVRPPDQEVSPSASYFWLPVEVGLIENIAHPYRLPI
jgi:hypothetical protein